MRESIFIHASVGGTYVDVSVKEITKLIPLGPPNKHIEKSEACDIHKYDGKSMTD